MKLHKPRQKRYVLDDVLSAHGHMVLRLPPYHPDLNAIEDIWGDAKQWIGHHNITFKLDDMWQLCEQWFAEIGETEWGAICRHVQNVEQNYIETEWLMELEVEKLVSVFVAVAAVRTVYLHAQKVTQQQMWSASGPTRMLCCMVLRNSTNSYPPRCSKLVKLALKIVVKNARDFVKVIYL
jgi:hypothetical protein